jgi:type I restriction enzyme S subunit
MTELPPGWTVAKLQEIASIIMGQSPPSTTYNTEGNGLPFFQGKAEFGDLFPTAVKYCSSPAKIAEPGDILISVRAPVGPTNLCKVKSCIGRGLAAIRPRNGIPSKYLLYYLRSIEQWLSTQGTGSTFTAISKSDLEDLDLPLAPLAEQRRIVAKLEVLLSKIDGCKDRLAKIPIILKRFRQSVLAAACSGRLTEDWRKKHNVSSEWPILKLSQCGHVSGGITKNAKRHALPLQVPYLRVANVYENRLQLGEVLTIGVTHQEFGRAVLQKDDLLFVEGNGSLDQIGRVALWDGSIERCVHQNHLIKFRAAERVLPSFVLFQMMAPDGRQQLIEKATSSAGLNTLSISKICDLDLPVPSLDEQREIVRRVESLLALADQVATRYAKAQSFTETLAPSLLSKAFRGDLVSNGAELVKSNDQHFHSAERLLDRLSSSKHDDPRDCRNTGRRNAISSCSARRLNLRK